MPSLIVITVYFCLGRSEGYTFMSIYDKVAFINIFVYLIPGV